MAQSLPLHLRSSQQRLAESVQAMRPERTHLLLYPLDRARDLQREVDRGPAMQLWQLRA